MSSNSELNTTELSNADRMESRALSSNVRAPKLEFSDWESTLEILINNFVSETQTDQAEVEAACREHTRTLKEIRNVMMDDVQSFHVGIAFALAVKAKCHGESSYLLEDVISSINHASIHSNEFCSVFDIAAGEHVYVSPHIKDVLGIDPSYFNLSSFLGVNPDVSLYHEDDIMHILRFATCAYQILSIPGLEFKSMRDFHQARFRVNVSNSSIAEIRALGHVMLEKRTYWINPKKEDIQERNMLLFYRWSVYHSSNFDGIEHLFVSDLVRAPFMQDFWYLFHAYLLGISPKFILMLDARRNYDRNKAIALYMNEQIEKHTGIKSCLDEGQVADCFAKTIRPKIAEAITIWEKREKDLVISSDQEAVSYAKRLGLLPIPKRVLEMMYSNVMEA